MFPRLPLCHLPRLLVGLVLLYLAWGWARGRGRRYTSGLRPEELMPSEEVNQLPKFDFHKVRLEEEEDEEEEAHWEGVDIDVNQEWEWKDEGGGDDVLGSYTDFNEDVKPSKKKPLDKDPANTISNNTAKADNQGVVFFNRVPKTGSQMMQELGSALAASHGFTAYIDPTPLAFFWTERENKEFGANFRRKVARPGVYFRHIPWINMTLLEAEKPIWVSMVRDPIDRVVSWFYYARWKDRPDDDNSEDCNKTDEMRNFCESFNSIRALEKVHSDKWYQQDFNACFQEKKRECVFTSGQGGWDDWAPGYDIRTGEKRHRPRGPLSLYEDYRSQVMFFCGNHPDCMAFNSAKALNIAKKVVDEDYSVVGVLEDLGATLEALEMFVPRFFRNSTVMYQAMKDEKKMKNKNPNKKPVSEAVRDAMKDLFSHEIEFYEFCRQRLKQQQKLGSQHGKLDNDHWPKSLSTSRDSEKFVLL